MKIGGYVVGEGISKSINNKQHLVVNCKNCIYGTSISEDKACRLHVLSLLAKSNAELAVLADVYERVYNEDQTEMLNEVANLLKEFSVQEVWNIKNLSDGTEENEQYTATRHSTLVKLAHDILAYDPILAFLMTNEEIKKEKLRFTKMAEGYQKGAETYLDTLVFIYKKLEKTKLIEKTKEYLEQLKNIPDTSQLYRALFNAEIKPSFIGSRLLFGEVDSLELIDQYNVQESTVQMFKHPDEIEPWYIINPPEYSLTPDKYFIISKTKEIVSEYRPSGNSFSVGMKSREYFQRVFLTTIKGVAKAYNIPLTMEESEQLSEIVARYTIGYGILELLLTDKLITDVYIDAPIGDKPIRIVHSKFGTCKTNILYSNDEANSVVSKIRSESGRPFDEAHPVLDYNMPDFDTRVAIIGPPLSPDGIAFAFRLHKTTPWTLPQFIEVDYLTPLAAGMLSFFVDMQATMLIAGSRGSGKTSLISSLLLEIPINSRILIQEDTLELPAPYMKKVGFNVQRLKTQSAISVAQIGTEVPPDESLRTALRLGDSSIILGEVRSKEAKVLYEAMRVGAAGNVVMGTIHADSAYSVWDRVVNDLDVATTSFKATDLITIARPIRFGGSLKRHKRVTELTEVLKHWNKDPGEEGGLLNLMEYTAEKDKLIFLEENFKKSELVKKAQTLSGMKAEEVMKNIQLLANSKSYMLELKKRLDIWDTLEGENTLLASNKLRLIKEAYLEEFGSADYDKIYDIWKLWIDTEFAQYIKKKFGNKKNK
jgi:archaeal flagellar protein FlaI